MKKALKVTICDVGGDWCWVIVNGDVYWRGHRSDFLEEVVWHLNAMGMAAGNHPLKISEEYVR